MLISDIISVYKNFFKFVIKLLKLLKEFSKVVSDIR